MSAAIDMTTWDAEVDAIAARFERKPNLIDIIHREAQRLDEPAKCGMCSRLAETGHAADLGWTCVDCCEARPEYAVATLAAGGVTTAWIGTHHLGTIPAATDEAVRGLLDGLAS